MYKLDQICTDKAQKSIRWCDSKIDYAQGFHHESIKQFEFCFALFHKWIPILVNDR